jgi:hypothetical protein
MEVNYSDYTQTGLIDDYCECETGYTGPKCEHHVQFYCYGIPDYYTKEVCSGHGTCIATDHCHCDHGWHGERCNEATGSISCFGYQKDDVKVCGQHGITVQAGGTLARLFVRREGVHHF